MQVAYPQEMEKIESPRRRRRRLRLDVLLQEAGGVAQVARETGTPKSHFSAMSAGNRGLGDALAAKLERVYGKPPGWFDLPIEQDDMPAVPADALPYNTTKVREVPVVGKGSGGAMPARIWTDGDYPVGKTGECADIATNDPHAFLVGVDGPSMIPRFNPGEFALVEPGTEPELEDDVLVRLASGETMIKRLLSRRGGWRFGSYNTPEVLHYTAEEVTWVYYVAHPVPRRKIKSRC